MYTFCFPFSIRIEVKQEDEDSAGLEKTVKNQGQVSAEDNAFQHHLKSDVQGRNGKGLR